MHKTPLNLSNKAGQRPQVDASSQLRFPHSEFHPSVPTKNQIPHIQARLITFFAWKRRPNSRWRTEGKRDLWAKHIHRDVMDGSGNAARTRRRSQHRRCCQQLPPNAVWETAAISCSKGKAKPLLSRIPRCRYCWQRGVLTTGGYSWRRQRCTGCSPCACVPALLKNNEPPQNPESWPQVFCWRNECSKAISCSSITGYFSY